MPGEICRLHRVPPFVAEVADVESGMTLERAVDAERGRGEHDLADDLVTPALPHVAPERLSVAIGEPPVRIVGHLLHRRQVPVQCGVAHDAVGGRMVRADGEVLGHSFHEPQRRRRRGERGHGVPGAPLEDDVELELMHHFVRHHMFDFLQVLPEEERVALVKRVGDAAAQFALIAKDVVLREVAARPEHDDRLAILERVPHQAGESRIGPFGHLRDDRRALFHALVVVHVEVVGLLHDPVEFLVLDLILAELRVLRRRGVWSGHRHGGHEEWNSRSEATTSARSAHHGIPLRGETARAGASPQSRSSW